MLTAEKIIEKESLLRSEMNRNGLRYLVLPDMSSLPLRRAFLTALFKSDPQASLFSGEELTSVRYEEYLTRLLAASDPAAFSALGTVLPALTDAHRQAAAACAEVFCRQKAAYDAAYPLFLKSLQPLFSSADNAFVVSMETHLRCLFESCTEKTLLSVAEIVTKAVFYEQVCLALAADAGFASLSEAEAEKRRAVSSVESDDGSYWSFCSGE